MLSLPSIFLHMFLIRIQFLVSPLYEIRLEQINKFKKKLAVCCNILATNHIILYVMVGFMNIYFDQ